MAAFLISGENMVSRFQSLRQIRDGYRMGRGAFYAEHKTLSAVLSPLSHSGDRVADVLYTLAQKTALKIATDLPAGTSAVNFSDISELSDADSAARLYYRRFNLALGLTAAVLTGGWLFQEEIGAISDRISNFLESAPYLWNGLLFSARHGIGDYVAQRLDGNKYSLRRTLVTIALTFAYGDFFYLEYQCLDHIPLSPYLGWSLGRSLADNIVVGPPFMLVHLMAVGKLIKKQSFVEIRKEQLGTRYWSTLGTYLKVWIPAEVIIQGLIPLPLRLFTVNFLAFFYSISLAYQSNHQELQPLQKGDKV